MLIDKSDPDRQVGKNLELLAHGINAFHQNGSAFLQFIYFLAICLARHRHSRTVYLRISSRSLCE